jgi:hypothetical protein
VTGKEEKRQGKKLPTSKVNSVFLQQKPFQQQSTSCSASIAYLHVCRSAGKHAYERFHQRQVPVPQHDFGHAGRQNQSSGFAQQFNVNACSTGTSTAGRRRQKTEESRQNEQRTTKNSVSGTPPFSPYPV